MINYITIPIINQHKNRNKSMQSKTVKTIIISKNGMDLLKQEHSFLAIKIPLIAPYKLRKIKALLKIPATTKNKLKAT